ncbi:FMN-binding negative transcriptional regulator [Xylophilus sp. Kf1]|nr:FMN-binding negative transcriptional regulator [Xylophilus sp. Kf1]
MYLPAHFAETRPSVLRGLLRDHPLGCLVHQGAEGLDADHLPFEVEGKDEGIVTLKAHIARANPMWQTVPDGAPVLVVFTGPQAYVSPNGYPSKHETHRQVPTWNYQVVHVHGHIRFVHDEKFLRGVVGRLTRVHEAVEPKPWRMSDSAPEFIDGMLKAIVGLEIAVSRVVGKSKLNQNKEARDREGAAALLLSRASETAQAVGRAMRVAGEGGGEAG